MTATPRADVRVEALARRSAALAGGKTAVDRGNQAEASTTTDEWLIAVCVPNAIAWDVSL